MGPFEVLAAISMGYGLYNSMTNNDDRPNLPNLTPPSAEPAREFTDFTNWQNDQRSRLLAEYYGGTVQNNPMDLTIGAHQGPVISKVGEEEGTESVPRVAGPGGYDRTHDQNGEPADMGFNSASWLQPYYTEMPTHRVETVFTGTVPRDKFLATQQGITRQSREGFSGDVGNYLKERGFAQGEKSVAQQGATQEMQKNYKQRDLDVKSRAQDIYSQTLATLFGEVSDAGPQAGMLAANLGNANQMFNQSMMNSYNTAMQQYAYNQNAPPDPFGAALGQFVPLAYQMYSMGAGGGGNKYGYGYNQTPPYMAPRY